MATAKPKSRQPWEVDFVSLALSRDDVSNAQKWDTNYVLTFKILDDCLFKACKVSLSYNVTTSSYTCSVTVPDPEKGMQKKCFTSHAPDMLDSMKLAAFKISTLLDGDVYGVHNSQGEKEVWG
jgi:hypothetical protein